jgi:glycerol-1-phosphate dehydrogenase [NAD(P)+]
MRSTPLIYLGSDAIARLIDYCQENQIELLALVADGNTYPALGEMLERALRTQGIDVSTVVLPGGEVVAGAQAILHLLAHLGSDDRLLVAVGSGTITDITRFVSHRTRSSFISVPTAPSVDGYPSIGAPIIVAGLKKTFITQPPVAIFADTHTLSNAPKRLVAAGFGDMVGKFTSLADWQLGHVLRDEPYDGSIAQRARAAAEHCMQSAAGIGKGSEQSIRLLMESLIESGLCMLDFGSSRPASGSEHHCSHYWELKLLWENRPALLHGAKVGVATVLIAKEYERIKRITRRQLVEHLGNISLPDREQEVRRIKMVYGLAAEEVIDTQSAFLNMSAQDFNRLKLRMVDQWSLVQDIADTVPKASELIEALRLAGAETEASSLGLTGQEVETALDYGHYLRNRFTLLKLRHLFGLNG